MPINSRQKGARGEREWAAKCREEGYDCRRGQQFSGLEGEDVMAAFADKSRTQDKLMESLKAKIEKVKSK